MEITIAALVLIAVSVIAFLVVCRVLFGCGGEDKSGDTAKHISKYDVDDDLSG